MSFGILDLIGVVVVSEALEFLSKNPAHLEFILRSFVECPEIKKLVGAEHLKQCVDFITQNQIHVAPFYELDIKRRPSIAIIANGDENTQFLGDYGSEEIGADLPATTFFDFDAKSYDRTDILVSKEYHIDQKLWLGAILQNGSETFLVAGINYRENADTVIILNREVPTSLSLRGWKHVSRIIPAGYVVSASMDDVILQLKLTTTGDYSVHRLLGTVLRYCLKSRRLRWEDFGLQVATFAYTPPLLTDNDELEFESVFTLTGKYTDQWIEREMFIPDRITLSTEAVQDIDSSEGLVEVTPEVDP